jgi:broad specificity phosphatase PhoE
VEVYLVRHAESATARERRFGDGGLSEAGREQARELGRSLAQVPFYRCLCSPLERARETAGLVLAGRDVPIVVEAVLAEGDVGALEGLDFEQAQERHAQDFRLGLSTVPRIAAAGRTAPGGESRSAFLERVEQAAGLVRRELAAPERAPTLVVSHGGLLNYLLQRLLSMPVRDEVPFGFDHCGGVRLIEFREPPGFGPFPMLRFLPFGRAPAGK